MSAATQRHERDDAVADVTAALLRRDAQDRETIALKVGELFAGGADRFSDTQVALFDAIIERLADAIAVHARAALAQRLAPLPNAPPQTIRRLAFDDIQVARPVLALSPRLGDDDLIAAARRGGRDHMLAIAERRTLSEAVTDVLIADGDRVVVHAVSGNSGAQLSDEGLETLIQRSATDDLLLTTLARRGDLPRQRLLGLLASAQQRAQARLAAQASSSAAELSEAVARGAAAVDAAIAASSRPLDFRQAIIEVTELSASDVLGEDHLADYLRTGKREHSICALAALAKAPLSLVNRAFAAPETDVLLVLARSAHLSLPTTRALIRLKEVGKGQAAIEAAIENYHKLTPQTASRVLRFLLTRESALSPTSALRLAPNET